MIDERAVSERATSAPPAKPAETYELTLRRLDGYRFQTDFGLDAGSHLVVDEPPPLGAGSGPNPARLLAAAVGDCLSASLLFCLTKSHVEVGDVETTVQGTYARNEFGRLRVGRLDVAITVDLPGASPAKPARCLELFEDYCVVTGSVRAGIDIGVRVRDTHGNELFRRDGAPA